MQQIIHATIITLIFSLTGAVRAMENDSLEDRIKDAQAEIATAEALADELSKKDLPLETKWEIERQQCALAMLSLQATTASCLNRIIEALQKRALEEKIRENTVKLDGATQVVMQEHTDDDFVEVTNPAPIPQTDDYTIKTKK